MTAAIVAYGLAFKLTSSTAILEIVSLDGPGIDRDMIEVTSMASTGSAKEFIAGLIDFGEVTLDVNYMPSNAVHAAVISSLVTGTAAAPYTLTVPDSGDTFVGTFLVKSFKMKGAVQDKLAATFTFKASGPFTTYPT